jgi:isopenicillin N synthase-like dioxygenase
MQSVPLVDLRGWTDGTGRAAVAAVDAALTEVGFFVVVGHGIEPALIAATATLRRVLPLPRRRQGGGAHLRLGIAGWARWAWRPTLLVRPGTPPDMKESYRIGAHALPGRLPLRGENVWPSRPVGFRDTATRYLAEVDRLHLELLRVCAAAAGLDDGEFFARHALRNDNTLNVNWYAPVSVLGPPRPGQYRIGPHTDFGTLTVLHRQPGSAALEVQLPDGSWVAAPVVANSFTINCGDMLAHWSGGRWRSAIHRMPAPSATAPADELMSVVYFCEPDPRR